MKLLIDENISFRILKFIDSHFPGSAHVSSINIGKITDLEIWSYAKQHDFVIVTYDEDFYEWQQLKESPPHIIWLRFGNAPTRFIAEKLIRNKNNILQMISDKMNGILEIY
jgi:predicted nuclease of predicted toxin-antitoxin system